MAKTEGLAGVKEFAYRSSDGLRLVASHYGDAASPFMPVVCLAGLSRNARDFHELGTFLATHAERPRRVIAFDYRGRGRSDYDPNADHYNPLTELNDVIVGMDALGIAKAAIVGTSRGGIIAMLMGARHKDRLAGVVLNDIGPVIEISGRERIRETLGERPEPASFADAVALLKKQRLALFPAYSDADWRAYAEGTFEAAPDGKLRLSHDAGLLKLYAAAVAAARPMWKEFDLLAELPVMVIRGALSDILSVEVMNEMAAHHPRLETVTVTGEGHTPLLRGPLLDKIAGFLTKADRT